MRSRAALSVPRRDALAQRLELDDASAAVCLACLSFVSLPLWDGDEPKARSEARRMAPILWDEGLAEPALAALRRARDDRVPDADAALLDVEARRGRSGVVGSIVLVLAAELARRMQVESASIAGARPRLPLAPPELN